MEPLQFIALNIEYHQLRSTLAHDMPQTVAEVMWICSQPTTTSAKPIRLMSALA